nr:alpha/beta hydrolase [Sphingomonas sp. Y57]
MRVNVGDISLFMDVVGSQLAIEGGQVRSRPTVILLHGGPAWDHLALRPALEPLADVAQLVFYDHRGLGRSDRGEPARWNLRQWAADLHRLIGTLGVEKPIILGQSFGGFVAQRFAIDYPDSYAGLILLATAARFDLGPVVATFDRLGGTELARLARSFFTASDPSDRDRFLVEGLPHYTVSRSGIGALSLFEPHVLDHFFRIGGEAHSLDFRQMLPGLVAPALVVGGDRDPVILPAALRELGDSFSPGVAATHILEGCGHGPARDRPAEALALIRDFIAKVVDGGEGR